MSEIPALILCKSNLLLNVNLTVAWESCNAARESLRSLDEEHQVLQSRVVQLQLELESAREQATLRENGNILHVCY